VVKDMKTLLFQKTLLLVILSIILLTGFSCSSRNNITKPDIIVTTVSTTTEKPFLSSSEAIGIARQYVSDHQEWARTNVSPLLDTVIGWRAEYSGDGKWIVDLRFSSNDGASESYYRWSVIEKKVSAIYLGFIIQDKQDISSKMSKEQVIEIVQSQGIPSCYVNATKKPIGDWTAILGEKGIWLVSGTIEIVVESEVFNVSSQWVYNGYTIKLQSPLVLPEISTMVYSSYVTSYKWSPGTISLGSSTRFSIDLAGDTYQKAKTYSIQIIDDISSEIVENYNVTYSGIAKSFVADFIPSTKGSYYIRLVYNGDIIWTQNVGSKKLKVF
jgi:hypothetical protein